ncbi:hypothetical protein LHK_03204 [Laribacter hongkongensis HLHK9]|uniref:Uncharacterized protein n=1 Tax=Laribacter hongkongensis (strain HLHK9) TaxID=557598 RepID=C1D6E7_LARHH|nr:hypothetical protein LHK_03204 [Laribacter hongkongensis HLHK9]
MQRPAHGHAAGTADILHGTGRRWRHAEPGRQPFQCRALAVGRIEVKHEGQRSDARRGIDRQRRTGVHLVIERVPQGMQGQGGHGSRPAKSDDTCLPHCSSGNNPGCRPRNRLECAPKSAGQPPPACGGRKVRAPQSRMPANGRASRGDGKWNREQNRRWPGQPGTGKGEKVDSFTEPPGANPAR